MDRQQLEDSLTETPCPSTDGGELSTTLGFLTAHPPSYGRTLSAILSPPVALHHDGTHGPRRTLSVEPVPVKFRPRILVISDEPDPRTQPDA